MKCAAIFTSAFVAIASLHQSTTAEDQATIHLRINQEQSQNGAICYLNCPTGNYCPRGETACRAPNSSDECFNPSTSMFQIGCDPGFTCIGGKCTNGDICYLQCPPGQYCPVGETACRAPNSSDECFNPSTSMFQQGCAPGFTCKDGKCQTA
ncbi:hypothetical protein PsorP6_017703 [Peronosclerospora sorghi]|uniref:Uncharacterized protein n=1 Tax=Peronosclerospora sorghi TaxID=230839 RepID=A0ACC0WLN8_9STRA|nr:hypothetical protein PsorP6_017703 [Peronosclerospora sorghi]